MDEKIQCEFFTKGSDSQERCQKPFTNCYILEDGSKTKVCDDHLLVIIENLNKEVSIEN